MLFSWELITHCQTYPHITPSRLRADFRKKWQKMTKSRNVDQIRTDFWTLFAIRPSNPRRAGKKVGASPPGRIMSIDRWIIPCGRRQRTEEMRRLGDVWLILALFGRRGVVKSSVRRPLCQEYFNCGQSKLAALRQRLGSARRVRTSFDTLDISRP